MLKIQKLQYILNGTTDFDAILHSDATWNLRASSANKISQIQKFKMEVEKQWQQFGKSKNRNVSTMDGPILTKFGTVMYLYPPDLLSK